MVLLTNGFGLFSFQNCERIIFYFVSSPMKWIQYPNGKSKCFWSGGKIVSGGPHIRTLQYEPTFNQSLWTRAGVINSGQSWFSVFPLCREFIVPCINCPESKVALSSSGQSRPTNNVFKDCNSPLRLALTYHHSMRSLHLAQLILNFSSRISPPSTQQSAVSSTWRDLCGGCWLTEAVIFSRGK